MAKSEKQAKRRSKGSLLPKLIIVAVLAAIGVQLRTLHVQVQDAQAEGDALAAQVAAQQAAALPAA